MPHTLIEGRTGPCKHTYSPNHVARHGRQRSMRRVMDSGKLLLVLDLDHTLLNSTRLADVHACPCPKTQDHPAVHAGDIAMHA